MDYVIQEFWVSCTAASDVQYCAHYTHTHELGTGLVWRGRYGPGMGRKLVRTWRMLHRAWYGWYGEEDAGLVQELVWQSDTGLVWRENTGLVCVWYGCILLHRN